MTPFNAVYELLAELDHKKEYAQQADEFIQGLQHYGFVIVDKSRSPYFVVEPEGGIDSLYRNVVVQP